MLASNCSDSLWLTALVTFGGVLLAALLGATFHHWQVLRERRLQEYSNLLTAFRAVTARTAVAVQGTTVYDAENPEARQKLHELVVDAYDAGDQYLAAKDRVDLVAMQEALHDIDGLTDFVFRLRGMKPISHGPHARKVQPEDFETISTEAHDLATRFKRTIKSDVGALPTWRLLWRWVTSPFRRLRPLGRR